MTTELEEIASAAADLVWEHVKTPTVDYWRIAQPAGVAVDKVQRLRTALAAAHRAPTCSNPFHAEKPARKRRPAAQVSGVAGGEK